MSMINNKENKIIGSWEVKKGKVVKDDNCERINILVDEHLTFISDDESGWKKLYQDPKDSRYWELTFPESDVYGGGPPKLTVRSLTSIITDYNLNE